MYKCVNSFLVDKYNDDGFLVEGEYMTVEEGSLWESDESNDRITGCSVRLIGKDGDWLEIPSESLNEDFIEV